MTDQYGPSITFWLLNSTGNLHQKNQLSISNSNWNNDGRQGKYRVVVLLNISLLGMGESVSSLRLGCYCDKEASPEKNNRKSHSELWESNEVICFYIFCLLSFLKMKYSSSFRFIYGLIIFLLFRCKIKLKCKEEVNCVCRLYALTFINAFLSIYFY